MKTRSIVSLAMIMLALGMLGGCAPQEARVRPTAHMVRFEFIHQGHRETFYAETDDPRLIAKVREELKKPLSQRTLHIHGLIARDANGVNDPWHWHYVNGNWGLTEMSMELCDGWPSYVETHLDDWLKKVGSFCPWDSRVVRELE